MTLQTASEFTGLLLGIGGVGIGVQKGVAAMRRFARFMDSWFGDGSSHPSVPERLSKLETAVVDLTSAVSDNAKLLVAHVDHDTPKWRADGEAWGHRLDEQVSRLDQRVTRLEQEAPAPGPIAP